MPPISYPTLLLVFMLHQVCCQNLEPVFRSNGSRFALGNCFGLESIVVYRRSAEGYQLLGNSSDDSFSPPADLQGRIHVTKNDNVVGLQIHQLTFMDSGIYRKECWNDGKQLHNKSMQLFVCGQESGPVEILETEHDDGLELRCDAPGLGLDGSFVQWYHEISLTFELELFLDSRLSLLPLVDKLQSMIKVRDNGASLLLDSSVLKTSSQFYCLVIRRDKCLGFQNMYKLFDGEIEELFASQGDTVVLPCPFKGSKQRWRTPLGELNSTRTRVDQMSVTGDFSLVISDVFDKHGGEYLCTTKSQDVQYSVVLCPSKPRKVHLVSEGQVVKLECDMDQNDLQNVQWYREKPVGVFQLIHDSNNKTIPKHLQGRVVTAESGRSLELSDVRPEDGGTYFCVVVQSQEYLDNDYEYKYDDLNATEYGYEDVQYVQETSYCNLKQKNILILGEGRTKTKISGVDSSHPPDIAAIAVGAAVGLLAVAAVIAAVILIKRKKGRANQDIQQDPACTQSLTQNV